MVWRQRGDKPFSELYAYMRHTASASLKNWEWDTYVNVSELK